MKPILLLLLASTAVPAATYSYSIYNPNGGLFFQSYLQNWNTQSGATNGSLSCWNNCSLYSATAGSLIYTQSAATAYEVAVNLDSNFVSGGGAALIYLHASSNALRSSSGSSDTGTFDAISLYSPTCGSDGACTVNLAYYERTGTTTT